MCNIWRIRNPKTKRYTFRKKYVSGLIQRRLGYLWLFPIPCKSLSKILALEARSFRFKEERCKSLSKILTLEARSFRLKGKRCKPLSKILTLEGRSFRLKRERCKSLSKILTLEARSFRLKGECKKFSKTYISIW